MFITPINGLPDLSLSGVSTAASKAGASNQTGSSFTQMLEDAISQVNATEATSQADSIALATGTVDDLHTIPINSAKAELALSLVVQIRNKALDAYTEIMRINV